MMEKIKEKLKLYVAEKKEKKDFMKSCEKEALQESREDIKAGIKEKIKNDAIKKATTTKGEKLKAAFNIGALGDIQGKLDRMTGTKTNFNTDKFTQNKGKKKTGINDFDINDKLARMMKK